MVRAQDRNADRRGFRRTGLSPPARVLSSGRNPRLVFIWDMDETLIVFQSLVSGTYMKARQMNPKQHALGKRLGLQVRARLAIRYPNSGSDLLTECALADVDDEVDSVATG